MNPRLRPLFVCLMLLAAGPALAQSKCDATKLKAYGKKVFCLSKVDAKAAKKGTAIDAAKEQKCVDKFDTKCAKADSLTDCTGAVKACSGLSTEAETCRDASVTTTTTTTTTTIPGGLCDGSWVEAQVGCTADLNGALLATDPSNLGSAGTPYSCGTPFANVPQEEAEDIYEFVCQGTGSVTVELTNMDCDLDLYILDNSCDVDGGCVAGSTEDTGVDDSLTFPCTAGETYYVVIEGFGFAGGCGSSANYTLGFATDTGGCQEDCDDGIDNDTDGDTDCLDSDCLGDPACGP